MDSSKREPLPDLRVRRTHKFLWDALIALMEEQDFESISVIDICDRAMVHRTTFYRHYEDKYALLHQGIQAQLQLLFEDLNLQIGQAQAVDMHDAADAVARLAAIFEHVLRHEPFYRRMLCGNGVSIGKFYPLFRKSLVEHLLKRSSIYARPGEKPFSIRSALRAEAHAGVLISSMTWWLENNRPYTPAEMGQYLWDDAFS